MKSPQLRHKPVPSHTGRRGMASQQSLKKAPNVMTGLLRPIFLFHFPLFNKNSDIKMNSKTTTKRVYYLECLYLWFMILLRFQLNTKYCLVHQNISFDISKILHTRDTESHNMCTLFLSGLTASKESTARVLFLSRQFEWIT